MLFENTKIILPLGYPPEKIKIKIAKVSTTLRSATVLAVSGLKYKPWILCLNIEDFLNLPYVCHYNPLLITNSS